MKKHGKFIISLLAIVLSVVMVGNFVGCSAPKAETAPQSPEIETPFETPQEPEFPVLPKSQMSFTKSLAYASNGTTNTESSLPINELKGYDVSYSIDENEGLKSYNVGDLSVSYDTSVDRYSITDTITVDDEISLEQMYYQTIDEQPALGEVYADYYEVEIDYTDTGSIEGIYYIDRYYIYEYDTDDRITGIYKDGVKEREFSYNGLGKIVKETTFALNSSDSIEYTYKNSGQLQAINGVSVSEPNGLVIENKAFNYVGDELTVNIDSSEDVQYTYGYSFNGNTYVTQKNDGHNVTDYRYIGDTLVWVRCDAEEISYILDNNLNYVGLKYNGNKYYFVVDPWGNVLGLIDCDGNIAVEYTYDIWGNLKAATGDMHDTLGTTNVILNMNGIYDATLDAYLVDDDIYFPRYGLTLTNEEFISTNCIYEWTKGAYFTRSAVTDFAMIHDKVVEVVAENLKDQGLDLATNLYAVDQSGKSKRLVDIYTLDYQVTPFSAMNLIDGNQVYEVIYHSPDSMKFEEIAANKLKKICSELNVSYFADYEGVAGTMKFNGQFVYRGYLIDYKCDGKGIVEYQVKTNQKSNYDQSVNIYDYDNSRYIVYVNNTFDLDFLDGVTIIPGISREKFEAVDSYLSDYMQSVSGYICDQMMIYDDPQYYNLEQMNVTPDYWAQMNLGDTTSYLEIQADGTVEQKTMPVWETNGFWTKIIIGAGVVLVTAVVATVAISIPGANCVVVSICVGAAKGAVAGALSGFAMGFVQPLINIGIEGIKTGNWDFSNYFNDALSAAADGFASGAITGAILGGIQGGLNPTYCFEAGTPVKTATGTVAIENIAVGDRVLSYDYITGQQAYKPVTATSIRQTNELVTLTVNGGEQITTTPRHPFYVVNDDTYHGYTAAEYLSKGDCILTVDGGYATIAAIERETLEKPINVYNFTVENNHSYYVSENGLLVHNLSCNELPNGRASNYSNFSRDDYLNNIDNNDLKQTVSRLYRPNAKIGDGGTADAVRYTKLTGKLIGGSDHIQKAINESMHLQSLINSGMLSYHDEQIAWSLLYDLQHALSM